MSSRRMPFGQRPSADPSAVPSREAWVRQGEAAPLPPAEPVKADIYTARMTLDVTPAMRARIKVAAFKQGRTVTDVLRELLQQHFPEDQP